jgi:hypothetical protein
MGVCPTLFLGCPALFQASNYLQSLYALAPTLRGRVISTPSAEIALSLLSRSITGLL